MIEDINKINRIYPNAYKVTIDLSTKSKVLDQGNYNTKLDSNDFLLWNWRQKTLLVEDPNSSKEDAVFAPHPESIYLANLIPKAKPGGKFLDVGIGTGILSIVAAQNNWEVTGVDINDKALKLATINSILNNTKCDFIKDDLAENQIGKDFDFCIANLPFEPTPSDQSNYLHSHGGIFGDKLIKEFIPKLESLMNDQGIALIPCFTLIKEQGSSNFETYLSSLDNPHISSSIIRLSKKIELSFLSSRFKNDLTAYEYLNSQGYYHFTIELGILKKVKTSGGFLGISDINIADMTWIMPSSWKGIGQCI